MKALNYIALILIVIGALNWALIGLFQFDLVGAIFGGMTSMLSRIIFTIVGLAGLWSLTFFGRLGEE
ncbi:putative uncharacterized protein [Clostridium sp. CAG:465]|jgi:hypothetical protein|nr:putative uncharacterized protein [Clostridium sp. CAG:465]